MGKFGEVLNFARTKRHISLNKAAKDLKIKVEHLKALEDQSWHDLPDSTFVKGFITSYAAYLSLEPQKLLALYRREFDERQYPKKSYPKDTKSRLYLTPSRLLNIVFVLAIIAFVAYLTVQYSSIFAAPKVNIVSPKEDETVLVPAVMVTGTTEKDTTVSVNGQFVPIDENGNFSYQYSLKEGKNAIEIIAAKRLSPKTRIMRTIRLIR